MKFKDGLSVEPGVLLFSIEEKERPIFFGYHALSWQGQCSILKAVMVDFIQLEGHLSNCFSPWISLGDRFIWLTEERVCP